MEKGAKSSEPSIVLSSCHAMLVKILISFNNFDNNYDCYNSYDDKKCSTEAALLFSDPILKIVFLKLQRPFRPLVWVYKLLAFHLSTPGVLVSKKVRQICAGARQK